MSAPERLAVEPGMILIWERERHFRLTETYLVIESTTMWDGTPGWRMLHLEEVCMLTMDNDYVTRAEIWSKVWKP